MNVQSTLKASELFAISQGTSCIGSGRWKCHWCGAPCENEFVHDDPPPVPFVRSKSTALCPNESYICIGCWLWRRKRVSINFLTGGFKDGQEPKHHSWWITEKGAWGLGDKKDYDEVYKQLVQPPKRFALAFRLEKDKVDTLIQLMTANDRIGIIAETPLYFTVNNIQHTFSVYELTESIKNDKHIYGPGVRILKEILGEPPAEIKEKYPTSKEEARKQGERISRDDPKKTLKKVIVASGDN